jgi:hypothetical protein
MPRASEYDAWAAMIARCSRPQHPEWHNYGGRGIKVCERWRQYSGFIADMGRRPPGGSLDRIDNDGDYAPGNCRWTDSKTQARNMRTTRFATIDGVTKPVAQWCEERGLNRSTVLKRINRSRWTPEQAVTITEKWQRAR